MKEERKGEGKKERRKERKKEGKRKKERDKQREIAQMLNRTRCLLSPLITTISTSDEGGHRLIS